MASVTDSYSSSTSINNIMALEHFPQEGKSPRESYGIFFDSLCDVAATFTASDPEFGLLGAVLSPAQYEIISPGRPFTELANPGPPRPLADSPRRRLREVRIKRFEIQQHDMRQLKKMMLFKIHSTYINLMSEPVIRMAHRSIQWIVQEFLFQRYGRLTPLEMEEVHKRLDDFYYPDTQTLPEHFSLHVQAHNTGWSAHNLINNIICNYLLLSLVINKGKVVHALTLLRAPCLKTASARHATAVVIASRGLCLSWCLTWCGCFSVGERAAGRHAQAAGSEKQVCVWMVRVLQRKSMRVRC